MKKINHFFSIMILASMVIISCEKADPLSSYAEGVAPVLTVNKSSQPASFDDSTVAVLSLSWTDPLHGQDKSLYKYYVEIDSAGKGFVNSSIIDLPAGGSRNTQILGYQLNNILYGFGFEAGKNYDIDVRLVSSYKNNNDQKKSQPVKVQVSPYALPKVPVPNNQNIWLVGGASEGGWNNPLPEPFLTNQKFNKVSAAKYELTTYLFANEGYLVLPTMGSWATKYCIADEDNPDNLRNGGNFVFKAGGGRDFKSPVSEGEYKITLDFMTGVFTVAQ
jgi:hypothetical protein